MDAIAAAKINSDEAVIIAGRIPGWMDPADLKFLFEQSRLIPDGGKIVELGSWVGRSITALLLGYPHPGLVWSIDTFDGVFKGEDAVIHLDRPPLDVFKENVYNATGMCPNIIQGNSADSAVFFEDDSIDFLFIDADHSEQGVRKDITNWLPKMKQKSIMSGHDWGYGPVQTAVNALLGAPAVTESGNIWCVQIP